jgi:hypothetical protein
MNKSLSAFFLGAALASSSIAGPYDNLMGHEQALAIAINAAKAKGFDPSRSKLDTHGNDISYHGFAFSFVFQCKTPATSRNCSFMVIVDRTSGKAFVHARKAAT